MTEMRPKIAKVRPKIAAAVGCASCSLNHAVQSLTPSARAGLLRSGRSRWTGWNRTPCMSVRSTNSTFGRLGYTSAGGRNKIMKQRKSFTLKKKQRCLRSGEWLSINCWGNHLSRWPKQPLFFHRIWWTLPQMINPQSSHMWWFLSQTIQTILTMPFMITTLTLCLHTWVSLDWSTFVSVQVGWGPCQKDWILSLANAVLHGIVAHTEKNTLSI